MEEYVTRIQKLVDNGVSGEELEDLVSLIEILLSATELLDKMEVSDASTYPIYFNLNYIIEDRLQKLEEAMK